MFVDLDWPLNASSLLSASAELLVKKRGDRRSLKTTGKLALSEGEVGEVSNYFTKWFMTFEKKWGWDNIHATFWSLHYFIATDWQITFHNVVPRHTTTRKSGKFWCSFVANSFVSKPIHKKPFLSLSVVTRSSSSSPSSSSSSSLFTQNQHMHKLVKLYTGSYRILSRTARWRTTLTAALE